LVFFREEPVGFGFGFTEDDVPSGIAVCGGVEFGTFFAGFAGTGRELGVLTVCGNLRFG
jgi:hypothetical protein